MLNLIINLVFIFNLTIALSFIALVARISSSLTLSTTGGV
jgi:hypothetical protein